MGSVSENGAEENWWPKWRSLLTSASVPFSFKLRLVCSAELCPVCDSTVVLCLSFSSEQIGFLLSLISTRSDCVSRMCVEIVFKELNTSSEFFLAVQSNICTKSF